MIWVYILFWSLFMSKKLLIAAAAGALIFSDIAANAEMKGNTGKCYGVAKAGKNDCASKDGSHSCAGKAAKDHDANEWMYMDADGCAKENGIFEEAK
jgi:uncharacterized membrane protein